MKKSRFIKVIVLILVLLITLVGCDEKNDLPVEISHTEKYVTIYTEQQCTLNITIEIKDGENIDTVSRKFSLNGDRTRSLTIEDFTEGNYDPDAIIIGVSYEEVQYTYEELHDKASMCTFLIGTAIAIPVTIFILKSCKKTKEKF